MVDDVSFGGSLDQVAFGGVGGDDVADGVRDAAFQRQGHAGEGMAQGFAAFALPALAVGSDFVFQQFADVGQDRSRDTVSVDRQGASHEIFIARALSRAMCTTQRLCSIKVMGQFGTSRVKGIRFRSSGCSGAALEGLDPVWVLVHAIGDRRSSRSRAKAA